MTHPRHVLVVHILAALASVPIARPANAQAGCIPQAAGVPFSSGPPQWVDPVPPSGVTRPVVDDPRWVGSLRQDYPVSFATEATFRALNSGGRLYFTLQALTDPNGTTVGDTIWIGFGNGTTSHLLRYNLSSLGVGGPTAIAPTYWTKTGGGAGGWGSPGVPPAFVEESVRWVDGGSAFYDWVVNLKVAQAAAGLGPTFKLWYATTVNQNSIPLTTALYQWPVGGVSTTAPENVFDETVVNPDTWGNANIGTFAAPCVGGISLAWNQIGADPAPQSRIFTNADNQFFAQPDYGSFSIVNGMLQARFRFANWGSTITDKQNAPWTDIALPAAGVTNNASGDIRFTCTHGTPSATTPACPLPDPGKPYLDQCMLVELKKAPQGPGVVGNLFFSKDGAVRNMDFAPASRFEHKAEINIAGLQALPSTPTRDVFVYIKTLNMPPHGSEPIFADARAMVAARQAAAAPPANDGKLPPLSKDEAVGGALTHRSPAGALSAAAAPTAAEGGLDAQTAAATTPRAPPPMDERLAKSAYEHLVGPYPTYEVHAFHDTGKKLILDGEKHVLVEPMVPFGYFVEHDGALYGWEHTFGVTGAQLEELAKNYYKISIPHGGKVEVTTVIEAMEKPKPRPAEPTDKTKVKTCRCDVPGTPSRGGHLAALLLALGLFAMLGARRRRRLG